jgi:tetratricopeptide (TPR) repeat protein
MKRIALLVFLLASLSAGAQQTPVETALSADKAFKENKFKQAIADYKKVIDMGYESANLYRSLGDAYFRSNDFAPAILYYEKSLRIDPNNETTEYNLRVAQSKIADKINPLPQPFYQRVWQGGQKLFNLDVWGIVIIIFFALLLVCTALFLLAAKPQYRRIAFWAGFLMLVMGIASSMLATASYQNKHARQEAIIFNPSVSVKSSPDDASTDIFVIHEGTGVEILDRIGDWYEIQISNGNTGWIRSSVLQII